MNSLIPVDELSQQSKNRNISVSEATDIICMLMLPQLCFWTFSCILHLLKWGKKLKKKKKQCRFSLCFLTVDKQTICPNPA